MYKFFLAGILFYISVTLCYGGTTARDTNTSTAAPPTHPAPTTKPSAPTTTLTPEQACAKANGSCDDCVKVGSASCYYCKKDNTCRHKKHLLPTADECGLDDARWGVCWLNYKALIIAMSSIGGLLILSLVICICCCCCCKKNNKAKYAKEDAKVERQRQERKMKSDERKAERKSKTDEIRRKYGLLKDDNPYQKFDNN